MSEQCRERVDRRDFLQTGAAATAAAGLIFGDWREARAAELPTRTLGRTGLKVTTMSFGCIQLNDASHVRVLERAIDLGMNLLHVSPGYQGGRAQKIVGEVLKRKRAQVYVCLKVGPGNIDAHLQELNTDYVDILIPPMTNPGQMNDTRMRDGFAALKKAGKIRWSGFAGHSNEAECLKNAAAAGFWDTCLLKYNVQNRATLDPIVAEAVGEAKMGILVMKGAGGLNRNDPGQFAAGLRNLLANKNISTLTLGQATNQEVDRNLQAVLAADPVEDRKFARYVASLSGVCTSCADCYQVCPRQVAVDELLRAASYRERGDGRLADELIGALPQRRGLAVCNDCGVCTAACRRGVDVLARLRSAVA